MKRQWDSEKLDNLLVDIHARVIEGLRFEYESNTPEEESTARVIGYWYYKLLACQDGPALEKPQPTITGPLFTEIANS